MMKRYIKILGLFFIFLLSGCSEKPININPEAFSASPEYCWPCQIYMRAFKALNMTLDASLENIAANSLIVLQMGFLFWLLFKAGSLLASFSKPDMKKEIATFATVAFKFLIVVIFLNTPTYIYDFFGAVVLQPLGEGFLSLSETVLNAPRESGIMSINTEAYSAFMETLRNIWNVFHGITDSAETISDSRMFGPLAMRVYEIVYQIFNALWHGVGLGFQLIALGDLSAFFAAILLIGGMCWLLLIMPLYFVDAFLRIGLVIMLMPLLMVGWVFSFPEEPKKLIGKVMHTLFAAFFDILFNCIFITFLVSLFRVYESQRFRGMLSDAFHTTEAGLRTSGREFGSEFIIITMLAWAMLILASHVQSFSSFFFEGSGKGGAFLGTINNFKNLLFKTARLGISAVTALTGIGLVKTIAGGVVNTAKNAVKGEKDSEDKGMLGNVTGAVNNAVGGNTDGKSENKKDSAGNSSQKSKSGSSESKTKKSVKSTKSLKGK